MESILGNNQLICPVTEGQTSDRVSDNDDLARRCAVDICGAAAKDNPSVYLSDSNFDQYVQEGAMAQFSEKQSKGS